MNNAKNIVLESVKKEWDKLKKMPNFDKKLYESNYSFDDDDFSSTHLRIFVSSSMPISLLKAYAKEASYYKGILVFNGLPRGSFKHLASLIQQITSNNINIAAVIDDEAFKSFKIIRVPAFVLSKEESIDSKEALKEVIFDKVTGNIGIKRALETFSNNGVLASEARQILKNVNHY